VAGVDERLSSVLDRIAHAAERAGRDPGSVKLVGATKGVDPARVRAAFAAGLHDFGENRIQEATPKIAAVGPGPRWHLIGHLQRNKVRAAVQAFEMIQTLDSLRLGEAIDRAAGRLNRQVPVLIEVNVAREVTKYGCAPDDVEDLVRGVCRLRHLIPVGLMTVGPMVQNPESTRPAFRELRLLRDRLREAQVGEQFRELSMGMSGDFEVAIQEGSTMVRIGRAIFGERHTSATGEARSQGGRMEREV
jgi:pyridoxal phosphate enzyme (YggS family)